METTHKDILELWPSYKTLADDIEADYYTVMKWKERNSIPAAYWRRVVESAHKRDIAVTYKLLAGG